MEVIPLCLGLAFAIFFIFLFWRICEKAGYSGALSLIMLIPGIGVLILLCILAFSQWPTQAGAVGYMPVMPMAGYVAMPQPYPGQPYPPQQPYPSQPYPPQQPYPGYAPQQPIQQYPPSSYPPY